MFVIDIIYVNNYLWRCWHIYSLKNSSSTNNFINTQKEAPKFSNLPTLNASRLNNASPYPSSNMTPLDFNSFGTNQLNISDSNINSDILKDLNKTIEHNPNIDTIVGNNVQQIQCKFSELSEKANRQIKVLKFPQLEMIPEGAFEHTHIEEVHLHNLKVLPNNTFLECRQLKQVVIPMVEEIGNKAFYNCVSLGPLYANSVTTIGENVFNGSGLISLTMNSLTSISSQFSTCKKLASVSLKSIQNVPGHIFKNCQSLRTVYISNASIIQPYAFFKCPNLETVHCSSAITIKQSAFESSGLRRIHMASATSIEAHAFLNCKNLKRIYWFDQVITPTYNKVTRSPNADQIHIDDNAFEGLDPNLIASIAEFTGNNYLYYPELRSGFKNQLNQYQFTQSSDQRLIAPFSEAYRNKNAMYRNIKFGLDLDGPQRCSIQTLKNAIQYCTNTGTLTLYRGIKYINTVLQMANQRFTDEIDDIELLKNKIIFDRSFISTSISETSAKFYIKSATDDNPGILLIINVPEGTNISLMPIANENDEVVLNRYQKLKICKVDMQAGNVIKIYCTAIYDNENTQQTEENIYNSDEFKKYQREFELRLGQYAYTHQRSYNIVHRAIERIKANYQINDAGDNIAQHSTYVQAFFSNPQYMGINIPGNTMDPNDKYLSPEQIKLMLKSQIPNDQLDSPGNLREKMAALQSSSPNGIGIKTLRTTEPKIDSLPRDEAAQINFQRPANYQDIMGLPRSSREIYYQSQHARIDGMSPIISNETRLVPVASYNNQMYQIRGFFGKRLIAGTSETTKHLLTYFKSLGFKSDRDLLDFRLAIMGYILPENNGSLYEILQASHEVGVHGTENVSTAETMDKTIDPLSEKELREKVCQDKMFPYELCLKKQQEDNKEDPKEDKNKKK